MRTPYLAAVALTLLAAGALAAGPGGGLRYTIEPPTRVFPSFREHDGERSLYVTVEFRILDADDRRVATDVERDELVVEEDGRPVEVTEVTRPKVEGLTAVLALDISGSMGEKAKWTRAQDAARAFLDRLDRRCESGLILFDHELRVREPPGRDPAGFLAHRAALRRYLDEARPGGGTAYLDATAEAVRMLRDLPGRRAVVLMTDGVDTNSEATERQVIKAAQVAGVPVYALGVGEPGRGEQVTTALVLDRSGSMRRRARDGDELTKIEALRRAAARFVDLMRPSARTTLLSFADRIDRPLPFGADKAELKRRIRELEPGGGTALYDAALVGVEALAAERPPGKKAVVVLTDGKDESPGSRCSDDDVIERAREEGIALYMLGLGRDREINEPVMRRMAEATGGRYYHATDDRTLIDIFENLSISLHDDGIDEAALTKLARETGGRYYPVRDVTKMYQVFEELAEEFQSTYTVTYRSRRPSHDGTARGIAIHVSRGGARVSDVASAGYQVQGVVVPEMDAGVYLGLLAALGALLAAPSGLRRLRRAPAEAAGNAAKRP
jgi:VWFA-related protein